MIEKISSKLAINLLNKIHVDDHDTQYEILEYGIECIINILFLYPFILYLLFT